MDEALACHTGGQVSNPEMTKGCINSEKIINTLILIVTPAVCTLSLSLPQLLVVTLETGDLLWDR